MDMSIWPKGGKDNKVMIAPKGVFSLLSGVLAKRFNGAHNLIWAFRWILEL